MVNFHDPTVVARDFLALKSLYLVTDGIYLWEYFTTLDYEFNIIRGHRPHRWTIWIYSLARLTTLMTVILDIIYLTSTAPINCQVWVTLQTTFGYLGLAAASLLILLRVVAIWDRDKMVMVIAASLWLADVAASLRGIALLRSYWGEAVLQCIVLNSESSKLYVIVLAITDIILLLIVLIGLLRLRRDGSCTFGIGLLLWKQGVIWLLLAAIADVPPAVFIILNLNSPLNLMFQLPSVVTMTIAATRMYRFLSDFASGITNITSDNVPKSNGSMQKLRWNQTPFNRIEVTVDTSYEEYQVPPTSSGHHT